MNQHNSNLKRHKILHLFKVVKTKNQFICILKEYKNNNIKKKKSSKAFFQFYNLKKKRNLEIGLQKDLLS